MNWVRVQELFDQADGLPKDQVNAFLEANCDDPAMRQMVKELLAEGESDPAAYLQNVVAANADDLAEASVPDRKGQRFGPYVVDREIGRGGMGEVYLAHRTDKEFEHRIALKVVRRGLAFDEMLARFRQERQILARLDHPNIVRLLDGGSTPDGLPYLAMDYVDGVPLADYCESNKLDIRARCRLMLPVCDAVAHAHRHLIIHRDLKPANILVTTEGIPKLLDFGIAKLVDPGADGSTTELQPLTPDYASPEQVSGAPVTTATDVYQLGGILFRLITGQKPDMLGKVKIAGDLDNIVHTAMHADSARRYASAQQLAEDLQRFLDNRPVRARADSLAYTARKWVQRSPLTAAAIAVAVLSAAVGAGVAYYQGKRAERRFEQVRALASTFVFEFDNRIKDLPGSLPARTFAVDTAIQYLDSLSKEASGDLSLLTELATAYATVARIQGDPSIANIGKSDQALASVEKALRLSDEVLRVAPDSLAGLRIRTAARTMKGMLLYSVRRQRVSGIEALREAAAAADALSQRGARQLQDFKAIAEANLRYADMLGQSAPKDAIAYYDKALAAFDACIELGQEDGYKVAKVAALIGVSRVYRDLGNSPEVVRRLEGAAGMLEKVLQTNPTSQRTRRQLALVWTEMAKALGSSTAFHMNQPVRALELLRKVETLREAQKESEASAVSAQQNFDSLQQQAFLKQAFALVLLLTNPEEGKAMAKAGLDLTGAMRARDPKHAMAATVQRNIQSTLASLELRTGHPAEALVQIEKERAAMAAALQADAEDLSALDSKSQVDAEAVIALNALGRFDEAAKVLAAAEQDAARVAAKYPEDLYFLRNHAILLEVSGDHHRLQKNPAKSAEQYRQAMEAWTRWSRLSPGTPYPGLFLSALQKKLAEPLDPSLVMKGLER
jgi:eukaryotic-like serine/threonine-protein kinase